MEQTINKNGYGSAKPADQLRELVTKAEELLSTLGDSGDAALADLRGRVNATVLKAKTKLTDLQAQAQDMASHGVQSTDAYVRDNPWVSVGIAAAVGAVVGALVSRRG